MGKSCRRLFISFAAGALMLSIHVSAAYASPVRTTGGLLPWDPNWPVQQNRASQLLKSRGVTGAQEARRLPSSRGHGPRRVDAPPAALSLATGRTSRFVEMPGWGQDDRDKSYVDANYWNICSAGTAAVAAALKQLRGAFALAFLFTGKDDLLIGARKGHSPAATPWERIILDGSGAQSHAMPNVSTLTRRATFGPAFL